MSVGGTAISAILGSKAPLASPVFTGKVKSNSLEGDASTSSIKPWSIDNLTRLIQLADWAKRTRAAEDFITLQAGIDQLSKEGGGILRVPFWYQPTSPIIMRKGVCLEGQSSPIGDDTDVPVLRQSIIEPAADMALVITQDSLEQTLHTICLRNITVNIPPGRTISRAVDLSILNSQIDNLAVINNSGVKTGTGMRVKANGLGVAWVNWITRSRFDRFDVGLDYEGSDSSITNNYMSADRINGRFNATGANNIAGNEVENSYAGGIGLQFTNTVSNAGTPFHVATVTGNKFVANGIDIDLPDQPSPFVSAIAFSGNIHSDVRERAYRIGANNKGGSIVGDVFFDVVGPAAAIKFAGASNTGWVVGPNNFTG